MKVRKIGKTRILLSMQRLVSSPGDVLVFSIPFRMHPEQMKQFEAYVKHALPDRRILVLEQGIKLAVLAGEEISRGAH